MTRERRGGAVGKRPEPSAAAHGRGGRPGRGRRRRTGRALRHRLEYLFLRGVAGVCAILPEVLADRAGAALGWFVARVGRPRWDVVREHLGMAFPDAGQRWRRDIGRRCYAHLGAEAVAVFRLAGMGRREVRERTRVTGLEVVEAAVRGGRGVVILSAHLGNWEIGGSALVARGFPLDVVVARQRNELFDRYLTRSRMRLGFGIIPRNEGRRGVLAALKAGRLAGILGDQDARRAGVFVNFFGRPASTARGPAVLALRSGALIVTLFAVRLPGWKPRYHVYLEALEEGPPDSPAAGRAARVAALTQAFTTRIEEYVREYPDQYFWLHKRWKTPPPEALRAGE